MLELERFVNLSVSLKIDTRSSFGSITEKDGGNRETEIASECVSE